MSKNTIVIAMLALRAGQGSCSSTAFKLALFLEMNLTESQQRDCGSLIACPTNGVQMACAQCGAPSQL